MKMNPRFGRIIILGFTAILALGGTIFGIVSIVKEARVPTLTEAEIGTKVAIGMSAGEVELALGQPNSKTESEHGDGWIYHNNPEAGHPTRIFVMFRDGRVADVILKTPRLHSKQ